MFWVILFWASILLKRYQKDLLVTLLKVMITSEDQKKKFAGALQNACSVINRNLGKRSGQSPVSKTYQWNSTADIFLGMFIS